MGLKATIKAAAEAAFEALDDLATDATFTSVDSESGYDPATGTVTDGTTTDYEAKVILISLKSKDLIGEHLDEASKGYLLYGDDIDSVTPGDKLTVAGDEMTIIDAFTDPAIAVWEVGV